MNTYPSDGQNRISSSEQAPRSFTVTIHSDTGNAPVTPLDEVRRGTSTAEWAGPAPYVAPQSLIDRLQTRAAIRRKIRMGEADRIADDLDAAVARIQALELVLRQSTTALKSVLWHPAAGHPVVLDAEKLIGEVVL